jgi:hypothetical protein
MTNEMGFASFEAFLAFDQNVRSILQDQAMLGFLRNIEQWQRRSQQDAEILMKSADLSAESKRDLARVADSLRPRQKNDSALVKRALGMNPRALNAESVTALLKHLADLEKHCR